MVAKNDVGFLYSRDKDTGEYKLLGKVHGLIVYGIWNDEATTIATRPSKIIDTTKREVEENKKNEP